MNTVLTARPKLPSEAAALEARFGLRVAARLEGESQKLPHDISERLRVARMQALAQAKPVKQTAQQTALAHSPVVVGISPRSGSAMLGRYGHDEGESNWWGRLGWLVPVMALVLGLTGIKQWQDYEQIATTAQLDAELLGDDLPPAALADAGFNEFLMRPPEVLQPVELITPVTAPQGE